MAAIIPYTIIAQGLYSGLIRTIGTVTIGTGRSIKSVYTHKNPDVTKILVKFDIEHRLKLIQSVLNTKQKTNRINYDNMYINNLEKSQIMQIIHINNTNNTDKVVCDADPIELCLRDLHLTIQSMNKIINDMHKKSEYHKSKWFNTWRTLNLKHLLEELEDNSILLDARFNDLIKISQFLENK